MGNKPLPIVAISGLEGDISEELDLKSAIKSIFGTQIRRIGPFIQLALVGAANVMRHAPLPESTNVYLTSGSGDTDVTIDVLNRTVRDRQIPKPLSFINTVSNAACFYLTKHFGIQGSTTFLSTREFALESALLQAKIDMEVFSIDTAIVGSVDIFSSPETTHRTRIGARDGEAVAQGTHWFRFESETNLSCAPIGHLIDAAMFENVEELIQVFPAQFPAMKIAFGDRVTKDIQAKLLKHFSLEIYAPLTPSKGHYGTNTGHTLKDFLARNDMHTSTLLHIQENERRELSLVILSKP